MSYSADASWPYAYSMEIGPESTRILDMTDALLGLYGYTREELTGPELWRRLVPDDLDLAEEALAQMHAGIGWDGRVRVRTKDGRTLVVEVTADGEKTDDGRIIVHGLVRDVTGQAVLEAQLQEREARLEVLNERVKMIMWSCDPKLRVTWTWGSGLADIGELENEHVGVSLYEYFGTDDSGSMPISAELRALQGEHVSYEMEWKDRSYRCLVEPLLGPSGEISGTIGVALDVTEERQIEQETKQIGRELIEPRIAGMAAWSRNGDDVIVAGDLRIEVDAFEVYRQGELIELTPTEFRLLVELARRPGRVVTRDALLGRVWGHDFLGGGSLITMAIKRLRSKIEKDPAHPELIETVRGIGYRLRRDP